MSLQFVEFMYLFIYQSVCMNNIFQNIHKINKKRTILGHCIVSKYGSYLAEEKGFEPLHPVTGLRDFESRLFDHLSTPPYLQRAYYISRISENQVFFAERVAKIQIQMGLPTPGGVGAVTEHFFLLGASGNLAHIAGSFCQSQGQEEQQNSHQNGADDTGSLDAHGQQDYGKQNRSQNGDEQCIQRRAAAFAAPCAAAIAGCQDQDSQKAYGDPQGHPQKDGCHGDHSGDLQECCDDADDQTGYNCCGGTVAFTAAY